MEYFGSQLATNGLYIGCRNGQALLSQNHGNKSESVQVATIDISPFCHQWLRDRGVDWMNSQFIMDWERCRPHSTFHVKFCATALYCHSEKEANMAMEVHIVL